MEETRNSVKVQGIAPLKVESISSSEILETLELFGEGKARKVQQQQGHHPSGSRADDDLMSDTKGVIMDDPLKDAQDDGMTSVGPTQLSSLEREWNQLFGAGNYLDMIKEMALNGELRGTRFRSICWKLFLDCLPEEKHEWQSRTQQLRNQYKELKDQYLVDPYKNQVDEDLHLHNPLSQEEESPWQQYFLDKELMTTITKDLDRLFPEIDYFQSTKVKEILLHVLFCYARHNECLGYQQGMHEILSPIVYVLDYDSKAGSLIQDSNLDSLKYLLDPDYIEHDAFNLFSQIMETVDAWYIQNKNLVPDKRDKMLNPHAEPFSDLGLNQFCSIKKLNRIQEQMLQKYDPALYNHLKTLDIVPQVYGIRWIRLLFGREFPLNEVLVLWDALFSDGHSLSLVDYVFVAKLLSSKDLLLMSNYSECLSHLMKFPCLNFGAQYFIKKALELRHPKGRKPHQHSHNRTSARVNKVSSSVTRRQVPSTARGQIQVDNPLADHKKLSGAQKIQSGLSTLAKRHGAHSKPKLEHHKERTVQQPNDKLQKRVVSPAKMPVEPVPFQDVQNRADNTPIFLPSEEEHLTNLRGSRTFSNPWSKLSKGKAHSKLTVEEIQEDHARLQKQISLTQEELDKYQSVFIYCGRKMDSYLGLLQDTVPPRSQLDTDISYLSLAGLKQIRDILKGTLDVQVSSMEDDLNFMGIDREIATILQKHHPGASMKENKVTPAGSSESGHSDPEETGTAGQVPDNQSDHEEISTAGLFFLPDNQSDHEEISTDGLFFVPDNQSHHEETSTDGLFFVPDNQSGEEKSDNESESTSDTDTDVDVGSTGSTEQQVDPASVQETKGLFDIDSYDEENLLFCSNSDNNPPEKDYENTNNQCDDRVNNRLANSLIRDDQQRVHDPLGVHSLLSDSASE